MTTLEASDYFVGYAFDALLTLTAAFERLKTCPKAFENDSIWRQECWRHELLEIIQKIDIEGVTGRVRFHNGDRVGEIAVEQLQGSERSASLDVGLTFEAVSQRTVEVVKLFVALPTNQSRYLLLPVAGKTNISWHGECPC